MNTLKKIFPISFKHSSGLIDVLIGALLYIICGAIAGFLIWLATAITGWIPVLGGLVAALLGVIGSLIGVYSFVGIILAILLWLNVIKG